MLDVKRALGIVGLAAVAVAVLYGVAVRQREASYARFVEQGDAALARDDSFAAIEAFSVAISLKSDSMAAYLKRGEAYRRRGEYDAAARDLRRAAAIDPLAIHPRELLGDIDYTLALSDGASAQMRFSRAIERYRESVALDDRSARLQYKLGLASYRAGQLDSALAAFREAIRLDPRFAEAHYVLGMCLRDAGQPADAVRALERAVTLAPALLAAREELADLYASLRRYDARLPHIEALVALQPAASRERALAFAYARAGNLERAVGQLANAAQRYPEDRATYVALGRLWLQRAGNGDSVEVKKALEALTAVVGPDSTSEALTLLGRAQILSGDLTRAEQTLQQATARFPVDPSAFLYLSRVLERRGRAEPARRALLDYAALVPSDTLDAPLLVRIAGAHLELGDHDAARRTLAIALAKDPSNASAHALKARLR
jgi:tetratricopeptide (TPR) repeat protein